MAMGVPGRSGRTTMISVKGWDAERRSADLKSARDGCRVLGSRFVR
jgi:hypothetical protein